MFVPPDVWTFAQEQKPNPNWRHHSGDGGGLVWNERPTGPRNPIPPPPLLPGTRSPRRLPLKVNSHQEDSGMFLQRGAFLCIRGCVRQRRGQVHRRDVGASRPGCARTPSIFLWTVTRPDQRSRCWTLGSPRLSRRAPVTVSSQTKPEITVRMFSHFSSVRWL